MRNLHQTQRWMRTGRFSLTLAAAALAAILLSGCAVVGGASKAVQNAGQTSRQDNQQETTAGASAQTSVEAESGAQVSPEETTRNAAPRSGASPSENEVILSLRGERGAAYDLSCRVGDEREESSGEVPERLVYTPGEGESLQCVIHKKDPGSLRAAMISGDNRTIRQTNSENATITFVYKDGDISGNTDSSPTADSQNSIHSSQSSSVTRSSGSSVQRSSSSQSVSVTD